MLGLLVIDRATMVVEELFRDACFAWQVGAAGERDDRGPASS